MTINNTKNEVNRENKDESKLAALLKPARTISPTCLFNLIPSHLKYCCSLLEMYLTLTGRERVSFHIVEVVAMWLFVCV